MSLSTNRAPESAVRAAIGRCGAGNPLLGIGLGTVEGAGPAPISPPAAKPLIDAVADWLGSEDSRLAASLVLVGYAARLVGPAVAVLLTEGILLDLRATAVRHTFSAERGFQLSLPEPAGCWTTGTAGWHRVVIEEHLRPVLEAVRVNEPVSRKLLWGNVASGLTGALASLVAGGRLAPDRALEAGTALLAGELAGSGTLRLESGRLRFSRRTCCLYYRLDRRATCGDCPLPAL